MHFEALLPDSSVSFYALAYSKDLPFVCYKQNTILSSVLQFFVGGVKSDQVESKTPGGISLKDFHLNILNSIKFVNGE